MEDKPATLRFVELLAALGVAAVIAVLTFVTTRESGGEPGAVGTSGATADARRTVDVVPSGSLRTLPSWNPADYGQAPTTTSERVPELREGAAVQLQVALDSRASNADAAGTLWVGTPDHRVLVVLPRDTRNGLQELQGQSPAQPAPQVGAGRMVTISGRVRRVPSAEQMFTWELTRAERQTLAARGLYVQADAVTPM